MNLIGANLLGSVEGNPILPEVSAKENPVSKRLNLSKTRLAMPLEALTSPNLRLTPRFLDTATPFCYNGANLSPNRAPLYGGLEVSAKIAKNPIRNGCLEWSWKGSKSSQPAICPCGGR